MLCCLWLRGQRVNRTSSELKNIRSVNIQTPAYHDTGSLNHTGVLCEAMQNKSITAISLCTFKGYEVCSVSPSGLILQRQTLCWVHPKQAYILSCDKFRWKVLEQDTDWCDTRDPSWRAKDMHFCFSFRRNEQRFLQAAQTQVRPHSEPKHNTQEFAWKHLETTSLSRSRPSCFVCLWCSHEVSYVRMFTNCTKGVNKPEFNQTKMLIADYYYADWQRNPAHVWAGWMDGWQLFVMASIRLLLQMNNSGVHCMTELGTCAPYLLMALDNENKITQPMSNMAPNVAQVK